MKIVNGIVHIEKGDSLAGISIRGVEVRLDTEREIDGTRVNEDAIDILREMDVALHNTKINDCTFTTTGERARLAASRSILKAMTYTSSEKKPEKKKAGIADKLFFWKKGGTA